VRQTSTGTPLDGLQEVLADLTIKIEAGVISIDGALAELHRHEVVDAAGYTWRIDPMTRAFIRRGPDGDTTWKPADPSWYAAHGSGAAAPAAGGPVPAEAPAAQPAKATQYMVPVAGAAGGRPASVGTPPPAPAPGGC
jgi:hypothetical protein